MRQQLRTQRIIDIANGNPRLLKWLLEVIQQPGIAADELLNRLEETEQRFRENILGKFSFARNRIIPPQTKAVEYTKILHAYTPP